MTRLANDIWLHPPRPGQRWLATAIAFWAYQGWENLSFGLEERDLSENRIAVLYWTSFALISFIYLAFAWTVSSLSWDGMVVSGLSGMAILLGGGFAIRSLLLLLVVGILTVNATSWVFGTSRLVFAAARMGLLPASLAKLSRRNLPRSSLVACLSVYIAIIVAMEIFCNCPGPELRKTRVRPLGPPNSPGRPGAPTPPGPPG